MVHRSRTLIPPALLLALLFVFAIACARTPNPLVLPNYATLTPALTPTFVPEAIPQVENPPANAGFLPDIRPADDASILTPTPDPQRALPGLRSETVEHVVQVGESLGTLASRYGVRLENIVSANDLTNPDLLTPGQVLVIPPPEPGPAGSAFKIIPDSELVFGPRSDDFDVEGFLTRYDSFLSRYQEDVEGRSLFGSEIVTRVAREFSVSPRLLLAVLEYQSGWVTQANPDPVTRQFPIGIREG